MSRQWPFLIPFVSMAAGLACSAHLTYCCTTLTLVAVFLCLLLASFLRNSVLFSIFVALMFFVWGMSALAPWLIPDSSAVSIRRWAGDTALTCEGLVHERPVISPEGRHLLVAIDRLLLEKRVERVQGTLMLYVASGDVTCERGDRIRFKTRLHIPHRLGLPGEFDYPRFLALQGVAVTGRVASQQDIVLMRGAAEDSLQRTVDLLARRLGDAIRTALPDERVASVLTALLIGDQKRIPQALADAYTRSGVNHILSISGFHVGILAAFMTFVVWQILRQSEYLALRFDLRRAVLLLALPVMLAYLFLTGTAPATARSVIMLAVCVLALYAERESDAVNTLLVAAFLLVAVNPPTLFDVSFQLSFISLWGLVIAVPPVMRLFPSITSPLLKGFMQFVAASVAASCVTMIPVLHVFKVASLNGVITNFLIVPLLGYGAVVAGFCVLPFLILTPAYAGILLWPAAQMVAVSNWIIERCATLPVVRFHGITATDNFYFLLFLCCMTFVRPKKVRAALAVAVPFVALASHLLALPAADGKLHITMLSVGQAESLLLRLPDGMTLLVDGGGYLHDTGRDFGQRVLAPALGALGVTRIDRMISTHDHPDHIGGLAFVARNFRTGEFWLTSGGGRAATSRELSAALAEQKTTRRMLSAGDVIDVSGGVQLQVLSPDARSLHANSDDEMDVNEESLVFRLTFGSFSMLFTADAGFTTEQQLVDKGYDLAATVLKVGHHGSRYSTSTGFLDRVHPRAAFISAGAGNRFGLPSRRTLELLNSRRIPVYRTDRDGTIELTSDGVTWSVSTPWPPD